MLDQSKKFAMKGLKTGYIGEAQDDVTVVQAVLNGEVQFVFISPESLLINELYSY